MRREVPDNFVEPVTKAEIKEKQFSLLKFPVQVSLSKQAFTESLLLNKLTRRKQKYSKRKRKFGSAALPLFSF